jgi:hypothetical protein
MLFSLSIFWSKGKSFPPFKIGLHAHPARLVLGTICPAPVPTLPAMIMEDYGNRACGPPSVSSKDSIASVRSTQSKTAGGTYKLSRYQGTCGTLRLYLMVLGVRYTTVGIRVPAVKMQINSVIPVTGGSAPIPGVTIQSTHSPTHM